MNMNLSAGIKAMLHDGERNAVSRTELAMFFNEDERAIRKTIERLRRSGIVIASSKQGYFYPETVAELTSYIHREERRSKQIHTVLNSARAMLQQMINVEKEDE